MRLKIIYLLVVAACTASACRSSKEASSEKSDSRPGPAAAPVMPSLPHGAAPRQSAAPRLVLQSLTQLETLQRLEAVRELVLDPAVFHVELPSPPEPAPDRSKPSKRANAAASESTREKSLTGPKAKDSTPSPGLAQLAPQACLQPPFEKISHAFPGLRTLVIRGCATWIPSAVTAFGARISQLELRDVELRPEDLTAMRAMRGLRDLKLVAVRCRQCEATDTSAQAMSEEMSIASLTLAEIDQPRQLLRQLGKMSRLEHLSIDDTELHRDSLRWLAGNTHLRQLELQDTELTLSDYRTLAELRSLRELELILPRAADPTFDAISQLPLEILRCSCTGIGEKSQRKFARFTQLQELELRGVKLSRDGITALGTLNQLRSIKMFDSDVPSGTLVVLSQLPLLRELRWRGGELLDHDEVALQALAALPLERLELQLEGLDDRIAQAIGNIESLIELDLSQTQLSDRGLLFLASLTRLEELRLHHTRVTNEGLAAIASMQRLRVLELDHTDVIDAGIARLGHLPQLEELRLDHTLMTDKALPALAQFPRLKRLNLEATVITRAGAQVLHRLPKLEAVNLANTRAQVK